MATVEQLQPPAAGGQPILFVPQAHDAVAPMPTMAAPQGSVHVTPYYRYDPQLMAPGAVIMVSTCTCDIQRKL